MAKHKKIKIKSKAVDELFAKIVTEQRLDKFAIEKMTEYGKDVVEERALPDLRDGLKPVQRRYVWSMDQITPRYSFNDKTRKSANLVGFVMTYHPHGDTYQTLVNMAWFNTPIIYAQGGWGKLNTSASAHRYTECKLSKYSEEIFLNKNYLAVTPMHLNYDGEKLEPLYLPALLPHLLLNGAEGIAVGVIVGIPPFAIEGVTKIIKKGLFKEITVKDCVKYLQIKYNGVFDCNVLTKPDDLENFYKTGEGRLVLGPKYTIDGNKLTVNRFTPHFDMERAIVKIRAIEEVMSAEDLTGNKAGCMLRITLKPSIGFAERGAVFTECLKKLEEGLNLRINVTERHSETDVEFFSLSMPQLINRWIAWRIDLEKRCAQYIADQLAIQIKRLELAILACINLNIIIPIIKAKLPDVEGRLAKALKISIDEAKIILEMTLRRLTGLSLEKLQEDIKKLKLQLKQTKYEIAHPAETLDKKLEGLVKFYPPQ